MPPKDRYKLAYIFMLLHGIGCLLPWNVFINADEYFISYKLNTTESYNADYRVNFLNYAGISAQLPGLIFAFISTFYQSTKVSTNPKLRFIVLMIIELLVIIFTITMAILDTSKYPLHFFTMTMVSIALINCCVAVHQTIIYSIAALLPMQYANAILIGTNVCGTLISLINILTKLIALTWGTSDRSILIAVIAYFTIAFLIIVACFITYFMLQRMEFVQYYLNPVLNVEKSLLSKKLNCQGDVLINAPISNGDLKNEKNDEPTEDLQKNEATDCQKYANLHFYVDNMTLDYVQDNNCANKVDEISTDSSRSKLLREPCYRAYWSRYLDTFRECWVQCFNCWCILFCTLLMFPAIQFRIVAVDPNYFISETWFKDVTCFLFFNTFSMIGSITSSFITFPGDRYLSIFVVIRIFFFIPFYMTSNYASDTRIIPLLISNDHIYVLGSIIFAFTNGYFCSLAMMWAPRNSPPTRSGLAGMLAIFFLIFGVFSGIFLSRGLVMML